MYYYLFLVPPPIKELYHNGSNIIFKPPSYDKNIINYVLYLCKEDIEDICVYSEKISIENGNIENYIDPYNIFHINETSNRYIMTSISSYGESVISVESIPWTEDIIDYILPINRITYDNEYNINLEFDICYEDHKFTLKAYYIGADSINTMEISCNASINITVTKFGVSYIFETYRNIDSTKYLQNITNIIRTCILLYIL